jgi:hypothetical protein
MTLKLSITTLIHLSVLVALIWPTCSSGAALSLDEKFQQLADKYVRKQNPYDLTHQNS